MASFKFDFAPEDGNGNDQQVDDSLLPFTATTFTTTSESIVFEMLNRCRTNAPSCQIIDPASCPRPSSQTTNHYIDLRCKSTSSTAIVDGVSSNKSFYELHHVIIPSSSSLPTSKIEHTTAIIPPHQHNHHNNRESGTDLIPGVYEGGLKLWECSLDLCCYLLSIIEEISRYNDDDDDDDDESTTMINDGSGGGGASASHVIKAAITRSIQSVGSTLEIGCGHGLPGCLILRENCVRSINNNNDDNDRRSNVIFSDFNNFVLQYTTIPNTQLNVVNYLVQKQLHKKKLEEDRSLSFQADNNEVQKAQATVRERSIFVAGDWMGLSQLLSSGAIFLPKQQADDGDDDNDDDDDHNSRLAISDRFDLILASETTYTTESCMDTAFLMLRHLKLDAGVGLVATKRFYFGVGGGTDAFISSCKSLSNSSSLSSTRVCVLAQLCLHVRVVQSYDTGNANIRDLLEVTCHKK